MTPRVCDPPCVPPRVTLCGISVGGHTLRHSCLPAESPEVAWHEIVACRRILQQELFRPITAFCYPGGYYTPSIRDMVARAGYRVAVTSQPGINYPGDDPLQLKQLPLHRESPRQLAMKLAFDLVGR